MSKNPDPTQSLWISKKYEADLKAAMTDYVSAIAGIARTTSDPDEIRQQADELKADMIREQFRPMAEKYVKMSAGQGVKWAEAQIKRHGKKT